MLPPSFHPLLEAWFSETYGKPTAVQDAAWPLIAAGEHVLALAPTGSGKTLTAFLAAISRLIDGTYPPDTLPVLYVSPLKALNEDIRRNLLEPLASLEDRFRREGAAFPAIRVETRSGDTPQSQRRRFLAKPPSILALTPESLAILLLNPRGRQALSRVRYVILDEIHAVLGTKRGAFLSCQIDRLGLAAGEFQRVALSATVRPAEAAAAFVGGLCPDGLCQGGLRPVRIVSPPSEKQIDVLVDFPPAAGEVPPPPAHTGEAGGGWKKADRYGPRYTALVEAVLERLGIGTTADTAGENGRTVLVFTDSRRRAERIAFLINRRAEEMGAGQYAPQQVAFAHHGSLSREVRRAVEQRLAEGRLPCVVATGSLELGIDIGSVDEVILAGSPGASATALQRIGRSGHGVGMVSRGRIIPFNGMDLVAAAAVEGAVRDRDIEETCPIENPLDILAQIILALCVEKKRHTGELYQTLRGFYVFRELPRSAYDGVIRMLTGYYAGARVRELKPRLYLDREEGTGADIPRGELTAADGVLRLLYMSGGVIPNRGYYSLRLPGGAKIGELDEEFVWERRLGDSFEFGARSWSITAIGPEAVEAVPLDKPSDYAPFWRAEAVFRSPVLVRRILELFDRFSTSTSTTITMTGLSDAAREQMRSFMVNQQNAQGPSPLPSRTRFPIEIIDDPLGRGDVYPVLLHTFRGGAVNYPLSMALAQDLEERTGVRIEALPDDTTALILLPRSLRQGSPHRIAETPESIIRQSLLALGEPSARAADDLPRGISLFRKRLEASGVFGAAFREAAERSLLLPKASFGKRTPLWITRRRSKRLFDAVSGYDDFPVTAEAWRSCLQDQFDMEGFIALLTGIRDGTVGISFFRTRIPSPFARDIIWKETNALMYEYDERPDLRNKGGAGGDSLGDRIIREALGKGAGRPALNRALTADFEARLRRELPLWTPADALALSEWVKERIGIPEDEWETLLAAVPAELRDALAADPGLGGRISLVRREGAALGSVVHREWAETWRQEGIAQLGPWLRYEGPVSLERIAAVFGVTPAEAEGAVDALAESDDLVRDVSVTPAADTGLVCDRENLDLLLRLTRAKARPAVRERPVSLLTPYLAMRQGLRLHGRNAAVPGSPPPWEILAGYPAPAALWESDIFPARRDGYGPETLDREIAAGNLLWYGAGRGRIGFCGPEDLDLIFPEYRPSPFGDGSAPGEKGYFDIPRDFWEIKDRLGKDTHASVQELWEEVWKGLLSADSFEPIRRGIAGGFIPKALQREFDGNAVPGPPAVSPWGHRRIPRALRDRWRAGPPVLGTWFSIALAESPLDCTGAIDGLDEETLNRDRVRLLLNRWGVLTRPLLEREESALSWGRLLPTIRRMELAGELMAGRFFGGINALQFARADIDRELEEAAETGLYWMNAADPASPAGLGPLVRGIPDREERLPPRTTAARLCFRGPELIVVSGRNGRDVRIFIPPDDADIPEALNFLALRRSGSTGPGKKILIESVNGKPAARSDYAGALKALGFLPDRSSLVLW